jgi:hypothetical protein
MILLPAYLPAMRSIIKGTLRSGQRRMDRQLLDAAGLRDAISKAGRQAVIKRWPPLRPAVEGLPA